METIQHKKIYIGDIRVLTQSDLIQGIDQSDKTLVSHEFLQNKLSALLTQLDNYVTLEQLGDIASILDTINGEIV